MSAAQTLEQPRAEGEVAPTEAITIRPFEAADYSRAVEIEVANFPEYPQTAEEWQTYDKNRDPKCRWQRFVACAPDGAIVAVGSYEQNPWMYHPRKFDLGISVDPAWQGRGIGSALFAHLMRELEAFDPISVRGHAREDYARSVRFLMNHGFVETMREWESRIQPATFDPAPFAGAEAKVREQGIVVRTLRELESDPDRDRKLWELDTTVSLDMPSTDTPTRPEFDNWRKNTFENPNLVPDAYFVAVDTTNGDRYVGLSQLWKQQASADFDTGATGVLREYRRRGIALALKLRALAFAKEAGVPVIKTWNAQSNRAMLSINEALGFVKQPAWILFARKIKDEDTEEVAE